MPRSGQTEATAGKSAYVSALEAVYGAPSQAGFGSVVFCEQMDAAQSLEQMARSKYQLFVGDLWERIGKDVWMGPCKEVYAREPGAQSTIEAELRTIGDPGAALSVPMILDVLENADRARVALSAAFDDSSVTEIQVFNLGDGEAMSGLLVAGRRAAAGEATFLVFLMD